MTVYLDSSYVIRRLLGVGKNAELWGKWDKAYASVLLRTECCRAANQMRLDGKIDDSDRARLGAWIETVCASVNQVPVTDAIVRRAAEAYPVAVGTLQAIHLATMQELESVRGVKCDLLSDDDGLVQAAKSLGFAEAALPPAKSEKDGKDKKASEPEAGSKSK
jgi:predicted nucleic acid-binding protein